LHNALGGVGLEKVTAVYESPGKVYYFFIKNE